MARVMHLVLMMVLLVAPVLMAAPADAGAEDIAISEVTPSHSRSGSTGDILSFTWRVVNTNLTRPYRLTSSYTPHYTSPNWDISLSSTNVTIPPGLGFNVSLTVVVPSDAPIPRNLDITVSFLVEDPLYPGFPLYKFEDKVSVEAIIEHRFLFIFGNPLPQLGGYGLFLADMLLWFGLGVLFYFVIEPAARSLFKRTETKVDDIILHIVRLPILLLIFSYGTVASLEVLDPPPDILVLVREVYNALIILLVMWVAYRVFKDILVYYGKKFAVRTETKVDDILIPVVEKIGGVLIIVAGMVYIVGTFGIDLTIFIAGGVVISMVIAFAAQDTLSNFFAGLHILLDRPFKEGDTIRLGSGEICIVRRIGLRSCRLYHIDSHEYLIVPNNKLASDIVVTMTEPDVFYRVNVRFGVAYGSDVGKVRSIVTDIATSHPGIAQDDPEKRPLLLFEGFGESSLDFNLVIWLKDVNLRRVVPSDIRTKIHARFAEAGIEIPFPQRVVHMKQG